MDPSEIKVIEKCGTIAEYWESHGYSKEEAKRMERQQIADMVAEIESKLPSNFRREMAISYLETNYGEHLANSFDWSSSPQGHHYWEDLYRNEKELPDKGRIQILMWVVESYKQEFGI